MIAQKFLTILKRLLIGVAALALIYWVSQLTEPWWNPGAYHWQYADASAANGGEQTLSIKAKQSTMTTPSGQSVTPLLYVTCKAGYLNVAMDMPASFCIGDCSKGGNYEVYEYFVTDTSAHSHTGQEGGWFTRSATDSRARRFFEPSDDRVFAKNDAPKAVAFIRRLAASKEFWADAGQTHSVFDTSGLAAELPRLEKDCPALK
ncbi:MAG: hypothetical protein KGL29_11340 [Alphaproteobacteria bacterium]|nr:hypothetical protein [Alphaproteobacteria bacterium]MDE2266484.1 hypothetical protein [Alphaproteobacteria bacterium]MDE2501166.1 hypothetical protein [Alphaproteobacteria bacterium]